MFQSFDNLRICPEKLRHYHHYSPGAHVHARRAMVYLVGNYHAVSVQSIKYKVSRGSICLIIVMMAVGRYLVFGYLDPSGFTHSHRSQ